MSNANPQAQVSRALPTSAADGSAGQVYDWHDRYGSTYVKQLSSKPAYSIADAGQYFIARNATPGTGLADHAAPTTLDDLKAFLVLANGDIVGQANTKRLFLDYLKLFVTAPGTNGTNINLTGKTDTNTPARYASAGTAITPVNVNRDSAVSPVATLYAGACVTVAANAARIVHHHQVRPVIPVIGDTYLIDFGASERTLSAMAPAGTSIAAIAIPAPPVIVGAGQVYLLHKWLAAQSVAGAYEFELAWWEA